jgi:hypothetical protein
MLIRARESARVGVRHEGVIPVISVTSALNLRRRLWSSVCRGHRSTA